MKTPSEIIHELTENDKELLIFVRGTLGTEFMEKSMGPGQVSINTLNRFLNLDILKSEINYHPYMPCSFKQFYSYLSVNGEKIVELLYEIDQL